MLADLGSATSGAIDVRALERRVADWQTILRRGPVMARQILRKLLPGRLALLPTEGGIAFRGAAACAGVLAGLAYVRTVVPPG